MQHHARPMQADPCGSTSLRPANTPARERRPLCYDDLKGGYFDCPRPTLKTRLAHGVDIVLHPLRHLFQNGHRTT